MSGDFGASEFDSAGRRDDDAGRRRGFTLVEILVVITIIGLIMALVGPRVLNYLGESKAKAAKIQIESFSSALDLYYLDLGRYPNSNEGLAALVQRPATMRPAGTGLICEGGVVPTDPWGNPYVYRSPGAARRLRHHFPWLRRDRKAAVERQLTSPAAALSGERRGGFHADRNRLRARDRRRCSPPS